MELLSAICAIKNEVQSFLRGAGQPKHATQLAGAHPPTIKSTVNGGT